MKKYELIGEISDFDYHDNVWNFCGPKSLKEFLAGLSAGEKAVIEVNSPGGLVIAGIEMSNAIKNSKAHIIAHVTGVASSMASVIVCACDEIQMEEASFMMIHDPWMDASGNAAQLRKEADFLDQCKSVIMSFYRGKFNCSEERLAELMSSETWYTGTECAENGLKCEVIKSDVRAAAKVTRRHFGKMPDGARAFFSFREMDPETFAEICAKAGEGSEQAAEAPAEAACTIPNEPAAGSETKGAVEPAAETPSATDTPETQAEPTQAQPEAAPEATISESVEPSTANDTISDAEKKPADDWEARFKGASRKINELHDLVKSQTQTIEELRSQVDQAGKDLADAHAKVSELAGTVEKQGKDLEAKDAEIAAGRDSLANAQEQIRHLIETRTLLTGGVLTLPDDQGFDARLKAAKSPEAREAIRKERAAKGKK